MRIGILADIHEAVEPLQKALAEFRTRGVDLIVSLGDACDTFSAVGRTDEVAALLQDAGAVGVWGNHDIGLCYEVPERIRVQANPKVLDYMAGMQPCLTVGECRFTHVEPWLNARNVEDLWYFDDPPITSEKAARSFTAVPERYLFVGHFHCWIVMTPSGRVEWEGEESVELSTASRYLVVIAAVVNGWCTIFDSKDARLTPVRCDGGR